MTIIGVILLGITPISFIFVYVRESKKDKPQYLSSVFIAFLIIGLALILQERITEFSNPSLGTIKTVTKEALIDAKEIKAVKERVENQSATIDLIAKRSLNEIRPEILRVADEVKKFERFINDMKDNLQKEYKTVSEEVEALKIQNNLPILRDKAMSQNDIDALEEIHHIGQTAPENSPLRKSALDMYRTVLMDLTNQYYGDPVLTITLEDGTVRSDWAISTARLMTSLSDTDWKVRARAAALLNRRSEKGVPDRLLHVARTDKNLKVVSNALITFGYVTRRINNPRLAGSEIINLEQFAEMFDIDKLEQWWKEHAAEVNEKLTEMKE